MEVVAQPSLLDEHAARKRRYVITMGIRALAIVAAAIVYSATHIVWLVLTLAVLGTFLPWVAVVMAVPAADRPVTGMVKG